MSGCFCSWLTRSQDKTLACNSFDHAWLFKGRMEEPKREVEAQSGGTDPSWEKRTTHIHFCFPSFQDLDAFDHDKGQKSAILCNLVRKIDRKCGENCRISGRRRDHRILSRLWLSWFSRFRLSFFERETEGPLCERGGLSR